MMERLVNLKKTDTSYFGALFYGLLEPARPLSLVTQKENTNLIKGCIDITKKIFERSLKSFTDDLETPSFYH